MLLNGKQGNGELIGSGQTIPLLREAPETFRYEKETTPTGRLRVKGILQKAATLNQNKRIYPLDILRREVDNYQKLIEERRSFGECVDAKTNICTVKDGWKSIADVKVGELVYTFDMATKEIRVEPVLAKTERHHSEKMLKITNGKSIDMLVTPNHKMVIFDREGNPFYMDALEFASLHAAKIPWLNKCSIRGSGRWVGRDPLEFEIYDDETDTSYYFDPHDWMAFLGIWLAEGHVQGSAGGKSGKHVVIHQKKEDSVIAIRDLLDRMGMPYKEYGKEGEKKEFTFNIKALHTLLAMFGNSSQKFIAEEFKSWSPEYLRTLLTWMLIGDGRNRTSPRGELIEEYASISKRLAEDVREIMFKLGMTSSLIQYEPKDRPIEEGRMILAENSSTMYIAAGHKSSSAYLDNRYLTVEEVDFDDMVYCVTTPSGNWLAQRLGKMFWTGNCDHPESSVVELKNTSHIITKTWWQGNELWGEVEILNTDAGRNVRALFEADCTVGISSRGVGSTQHVNGADVVQGDFMLICWDFVSEPSTPNAFMFKENKEIPLALVENYFRSTGQLLHREVNRIKENYEKMRGGN